MREEATRHGERWRERVPSRRQPSDIAESRGGPERQRAAGHAQGILGA